MRRSVGCVLLAGLSSTWSRGEEEEDGEREPRRFRGRAGRSKATIAPFAFAWVSRKQGSWVPAMQGHLLRMRLSLCKPILLNASARCSFQGATCARPTMCLAASHEAVPIWEFTKNWAECPKSLKPQARHQSHIQQAKVFNLFPLIINDVPPPLIINNPGGQKLFIIRAEYLLRGFGRAAFKFLLKSIEIKIESKLIN